MGGKIGVLVEVNCESDFVARTEGFQQLVKEIAMHIAAADPKYVRREDVPAAVVEQEKAIYRASSRLGQAAAGHREDRRGQDRQLLHSGPCLLDQPSVRDQNVTIGENGDCRRSRKPARTSRWRASRASSWARAPRPNAGPLL